MDIEFLKLVRRIATALEAIAENTKTDKAEENDSHVRGFNVGGTD